MTAERCENCYYWREPQLFYANSTLPGRRDCRRHSPGLGSPLQDRMWPQTILSDWCGDWRAEEATVEQV